MNGAKDTTGATRKRERRETYLHFVGVQLNGPHPQVELVRKCKVVIVRPQPRVIGLEARLRISILTATPNNFALPSYH